MQLDVNTPAPFTPIFLPNKPEINALNRGKKSINVYIFSLIIDTSIAENFKITQPNFGWD